MVKKKIALRYYPEWHEVLSGACWCWQVATATSGSVSHPCPGRPMAGAVIQGRYRYNANGCQSAGETGESWRPKDQNEKSGLL